MNPYYKDDLITLHHGDCLEVLATLPEASVDAIVTDPPYALGFMGKTWDKQPDFQDWCRTWATECLRVLKPGGHMLAFGGARTWHRLACGVEDAGFDSATRSLGSTPKECQSPSTLLRQLTRSQTIAGSASLSSPSGCVQRGLQFARSTKLPERTWGTTI